MENWKLELEKIYRTDIAKINITQCKTGDVNSSYIAEYKSRKYFVKVQDKEDLPDLYEKQIDREVIGISLCKQEGIPCPNIVHYSFNEKYIIMEYLEYPVLGQVWNELDQTQKLRIKSQALEIVKKMNNIASEYFGAIYENGKIGKFRNWKEAYKNIICVAVEDCKRYGSLDCSEGKRIIEAVDKNCEDLEEKVEAHFSHLDFHWNNIFISKGQESEIKAVFDFGSSMYTPNYMGYFRLDGGFLYATEHFYKDIACPVSLSSAQRICADIYNTLDYFVFLSYKKMNFHAEKIRLLHIVNDNINKE